MRKKYIDSNLRARELTSKVFHINGKYNGYISLIDIIEIQEKVMVRAADVEICLYDTGYKSVIFMPDNEFWCIEAIYDNELNIVEWYFDTTKSNYVDENGRPFFDDLYLDIVVLPNGRVIVLDEDELSTALGNESISIDDYNLAHKTAKMIINEYIPKEGFMETFLRKYLAKFTS